MEISPLILFVGGLGVLFFGYFFGLFEGRGQGYKRRKAEEAETEKHEVLERGTAPAQPPIPQVIPDDPGLLRLKNEDGQLRVDLDGNPVEAEGISPDQRRRLIALVTLMRPWLEGRTTAAAPAPPQPAARPAAPPPGPAPRASEPISPIVTAAVSGEEPAAGPRSMVAQIDEILQKNIAGTELANRGIKIQEGPAGGVVVLVGMQRYSAVSDVPDPTVQAALRTAIAAWERKYTPGL
jgi:hypothetical protein